MRVGPRVLLPLLKVGISAALIVWILRRVDLDAVGASMRQADSALLSLAFALFFLGYSITAVRWRLLLRAQGATAPLGFLVEPFIVVAVFFNNFLPSTVGGDAVRMMDSYRLRRIRAHAVSVVVVDCFLTIFALVTSALIAVWFASPIAKGIAGLSGWALLAAAGVAGHGLAHLRQCRAGISASPPIGKGRSQSSWCYQRRACALSPHSRAVGTWCSRRCFLHSCCD